MRKVVFDNVSGQFWSEDPANVTPEDPRAVVVEVPEDVAAWRLSYNPKTEQVTVKYSGMTDSQAEAQQTIDLAPPPPPNDPA
jgi:hypothetical protein